MEFVEINSIDTKFETFRLKDSYQEKIILSSVLESGIREPLQCIVTTEKHFILIDGFKRYRSARKLGLKTIPCVELSTDEADGILKLLQAGNSRTLNILEQAALVDALSSTHGLETAEIARRLEKSTAWVSTRLGILSEMSGFIKQEIFAGRFPARSYMYTLRQFTRVQKIKKSELDDFVKAVAGKHQSTRDIDKLAYCFFYGGHETKDQIKTGNLSWTLGQLKHRDNNSFGAEPNDMSELEQRVIKDLKISQKYMNHILHSMQDQRLKTISFFREALLLTEGILSRVGDFTHTLKLFVDTNHQKERHHDKRGQKKSDLCLVPRGQEQKRNSETAQNGQEDGQAGHFS